MIQNKCRTCNDCRECQEIRILEEEPYNWKKHFWFDFPEMLNFFLKWLLILAVVEVVTMSMVTVATTIITQETVEKSLYENNLDR